MNAWRRRLLLHPATVLAALTVAVNDAYLKHLHPGWLTGKVSDVAGVWMVGAVAVALSGRRTLATVAVGLSFAALKTLPDAARLAEPVLGGPTLTDRSDLLALAVLPGLWLFAGGLMKDRWPQRATALSSVACVLMVAATAAVTSATSCGPRPEVEAIRVAPNGSVVATMSEWTDEWFVLDIDSAPHKASEVLVNASPSAGTSVCVEVRAGEERCFEVRPHEGLFEDGSLLYSMSYSDAKRFEDRNECFQADPFSEVVVGRSGGEPALWINMGMAGVVRYDLADGTVTQFGLPDLNAMRLDHVQPGPSAPYAVTDAVGGIRWGVLGVIVALVILLVLSVLIALDFRSRRRAGA